MKVEEKRKTIFDDKKHADAFWPLSTEVADSELIRATASETDEVTAKSWRIFSFETLKGLVFFLPGTILLALIGIVSMVIFADIFIYGRSYESLPHNFLQQIMMLIAAGGISSLMIWFGIGRLKDQNHFALPLSVFTTGVVIGAMGLIIEAFVGTRGDFIEAFADYNVIVFILPLLLVVPILVREWLKLKREIE